MAADHQPPRDDGRCAEAMDFHILVVRRLDRVRSRNDIAQDVVATDRPIVFCVHESVSQQAPKQCGITAGQPESPIVFKPKEHLRLGILDPGRLSVRILRGEQQDSEEQIHLWTPASWGVLAAFNILRAPAASSAC